jgi:hypothetical protein
LRERNNYGSDCTGTAESKKYYLSKMLPYLLIKEKFETPLGVVECGLSSSELSIEAIDKKQYDHGESTVYRTSSHIIELITFKRRLPLFNGDVVKDTAGWIWKITKEIDSSETFKLHCLLTPSDVSIKLNGSDPGEHLDSAYMNTEEWMLHVGTEDGEIMHNRALNEDWMPSRFKNQLSFQGSFTSVQPDGLVTIVPELDFGEHIHFHYLVAYDQQSEVKVNTWFAVDEFKRNLENWIGVW